MRPLLFLMTFIIAGLSGFTAAMAVPLFATDPTEEEPYIEYISDIRSQGRTIEDIRIEGLTRTAEFVVTRELEITVGKDFDLNNYHRSLQKIRNLFIFRSVDGELIKSGQNVKVSILVEEKWTSIPYFLLGSAGGTSFFEVGFFDVNLLGRYLELGLAYERRGPANSFKAWYRNRRFLNRDLSFKAYIQDRSAVLPFYNIDDTLQNEYSANQKRVEFALDKDVLSKFALGVGVEVNTISYNRTLVSSEGDKANALNPVVFPDSSRAYIARIRARFGELNWDDYLLDGLLIESSFDIAKPILNSDSRFYRLTTLLLNYYQLPRQSNLGFRLGHGYTSSQAIAQRYFLGGLQHVRGYRDNQFNTNNYLFGNAEIRVPSFRWQLALLQHVAFVDFANISSTADKIFHVTPNASAGIGFRIVVPPIFLLSIRADYAWTFGPIKRQGLTLGMVQYF